VRDPLVDTRPDRRQLLSLTNRAHGERPHRRAISCQRRIVWTVLLALLGAVAGAPGAAQEASRQQMQGLDEQVQEIKSDVLSIAAELRRLEERLLYPSNTQVAVFVSLGEGETFRLDSVQIQIDGEPAAHHIYSFKELEALQKGGVQRIYTGNVATGEHRLSVAVAGKTTSGSDFSAAEAFTFSKEAEPKLVGITLAGGSGDASIELGAW